MGNNSIAQAASLALSAFGAVWVIRVYGGRLVRRIRLMMAIRAAARRRRGSRGFRLPSVPGESIPAPSWGSSDASANLARLRGFVSTSRHVGIEDPASPTIRTAIEVVATITGEPKSEIAWQMIQTCPDPEIAARVRLLRIGYLEEESRTDDEPENFAARTSY